jgi:hypothetical protein
MNKYGHCNSILNSSKRRLKFPSTEKGIQWNSKIGIRTVELWCFYVVEYYIIKRTNKLYLCTAWMNFTNILLSDGVSQQEYILYVFIYVRLKTGNRSSVLVSAHWRISFERARWWLEGGIGNGDFWGVGRILFHELGSSYMGVFSQKCIKLCTTN